MAMQTVRESLHLSGPQVSWWNAFGSQPLDHERSLSREGSDSFAGVKVVAAGETEQVVDKQSNSTTHFAFSLGDVKSSRIQPKPHGVALSMNAPCLELGFTQSPIYTKYPCVEQEYYGVVSAYGSQSKLMVPLNMETEGSTIYVNSKQYHGIIRRRKSRAKAAAFLGQNNLSTRNRKPYMHHSRHLHALRRPRGSGGRFLNTKSQNLVKTGTNSKKVDGTMKTMSKSQQSNSQNSEVVHPETGTMNLANGLNVSGSEVTSMNYFLSSSSVHPLGGMVKPSKWINAAATMDNGCCHYKT
ncbi:unnamed protein product [Cochlearia groenlandica]